MKTLKELKEQYAAKRAHCMLAATEQAIANHGADCTDWLVISGLPSKTAKCSNMYKACTSHGWKNWAYYYGAHRQQSTQGWYFICVKTN